MSACSSKMPRWGNNNKFEFLPTGTPSSQVEGRLKESVHYESLRDGGITALLVQIIFSARTVVSSSAASTEVTTPEPEINEEEQRSQNQAKLIRSKLIASPSRASYPSANAII